MNYGSVDINEYGAHWNFFTIAAVKIVSTVFEIFICEKPIRGFIISFLLPVLNQFIFTGFNSEGISSTVGYVSIFLVGQAIFISFKNAFLSNKTRYLLFFEILNLIKFYML